MNKVSFISILIVCFLVISLLSAYCGSRRVSGTIRTTIHLIPKVDLEINEKEINIDSLSLNSQELSDVLSLNKDGVIVDRVFRNNRETILVTKVCAEPL